MGVLSDTLISLGYYRSYIVRLGHDVFRDSLRRMRWEAGHGGEVPTVADECAELGLFFCLIMESVPEEVHVATAHWHYLLQQQAQR